MANKFYSVFNVVCVVNVCPVHAVDLNSLTLRVVILPGQKCIKKERKKINLLPIASTVRELLINKVRLAGVVF